MRVPATALARDADDGAAAERRVCEFYGVETLDGFGAFTRAEVAAAALALAYVKRTQFEARPALSPPTRRARGARLEIDPATRANLELTRTLSGAREGSLLATIDLTVTPAGARLLAERLASPLTDPDAVNGRLDAVDFLVAAAPMREALRRALAACARFPARAGAPEPRPRRSARPRGRPRRRRRGRRHWRTCSKGGRIAGGAPQRLCPPSRRLRRARTRPRSEPGRRTAACAARRRLRARGRAAALDEARALRDESRRVIAGTAGGLRRANWGEAAQDQTQQLPRLLHRDAAGGGRDAAQAAAQRDLRPSPDDGRRHALLDRRARRARGKDRLGRRPGAALELGAFERLRLACLAEGERLRSFAAALAEIDVAAASPSLRSGATGRGRWSTIRSPSASRAGAIRSWRRR